MTRLTQFESAVMIQTIYWIFQVVICPSVCAMRSILPSRERDSVEGPGFSTCTPLVTFRSNALSVKMWLSLRNFCPGPRKRLHPEFPDSSTLSG